jgi:chitinase
MLVNKARFLKIMSLILVTGLFIFSPLAGQAASAMGRDKQAPTRPVNLQVVSLTASTVSLSWEASSDNVSVAMYYMYMNNALTGTSQSPSYKATGLLPDTTYTFYVKAKDPTGNTSPASATVTATTSTVTPPVFSPYRIIGYYTSWSAYNGFTPDKIAVDRVTHINYAFAVIGNDLKIALGDATIDISNFGKLQALKKYNPSLKTLISIGGWNDSGKFSDVALTEASRNTFADSCLAFIDQYGFDGVDLDWEYPVGGGLSGNTVRPEDKHNFTLLLSALRARLGDQHLLTIAGACGQDYFNHVEPPEIAKSVDFINLMTYDIHGGWDSFTDFNAPLHRDTASPQFQWSIEDAVGLWLSQIPSSQIVVGIPFYGRRYGAVKSASSANPGLYSSFGRCTTITYQEIVKSYLNVSGYNLYFHQTAGVPWLFNGSIFISYEDPSSIGLKTAYIIDNGLGGAMVWELSQDNGKTLINAVYDGLN